MSLIALLGCADEGKPADNDRDGQVGGPSADGGGGSMNDAGGGTPGGGTPGGGTPGGGTPGGGTPGGGADAGSSDGGGNAGGAGDASAQDSGARDASTQDAARDASTSTDASASQDSGSSSPDAATQISCDPRKVACDVVEPTCPGEQVASVVQGCYGPCVRIEQCSCSDAPECPHEEKYTCHRSARHCGPYLN